MATVDFTLEDIRRVVREEVRDEFKPAFDAAFKPAFDAAFKEAFRPAFNKAFEEEIEPIAEVIHGDIERLDSRISELDEKMTEGFSEVNRKLSGFGRATYEIFGREDG